MRSAECGVRSAECGVRSAECGKRGVWKTRSVENAECGKCGVLKKIYKKLKRKKKVISPHVGITPNQDG